MADSSSFPFLRGMDNSRRFVLLGALAALVVVMALVGRWASTPSYVTLFRDLDLKEAGQVGENLARANIPYRLAGGGSEVEVPTAEVARARVALARDGLPTQGRPGLELFDKPSWGMTDFTQRVTYQRALEGELARTIAQIHGVDRAEVHLLLPAASALRRADRQAGASVVLTLKGGTPLAPETVQGINYIVSNAVEGLSAENVAVMDDAGRVLSLPASGLAGAGLTGRQLEVQRGMEKQVIDKIEDLVGTVVGVGRVRAQVAAMVSFDQVDATTETYNPDGQVLQNEQRSEGGSPDGSGPQTIVNNQYQNSRRVEKSQSLAGRLAKLTVAVLVDEKAMRPGERERQLADVDAMVRNAVGVDTSRGDRLSVLAVPFEPVQVAGPDKGAKVGPDPVQIVERMSHPIVGVLAIVGMLILALQMKGLLMAGKRPAPAGPAVASAATNGSSASVAEMESLPPPEDSQVARMRQRLQQSSAERPEVTAQVLKAWLAEG